MAVEMAAISRYFCCRMADLSTESTDSCLLHLLQEESARAPSVAAKAYMHDEASASGSNSQDGRKKEYPKVGCERARSGPHRGSRGSVHCFSIDLHVQDIPCIRWIFFILYNKRSFIKKMPILTFLSNKNTISIICIFAYLIQIFS